MKNICLNIFRDGSACHDTLSQIHSKNLGLRLFSNIFYSECDVIGSRTRLLFLIICLLFLNRRLEGELR